MRISVVSSSLNADSRSRVLAIMCRTALSRAAWIAEPWRAALRGSSTGKRFVPCQTHTGFNLPRAIVEGLTMGSVSQVET